MSERVVRKSFQRVRTPVKKSTHTSPVKQAFKDTVNINKIMERWNKGQQITHINLKTPLYGDFTQAGDLKESLERVAEAQDKFDALPAAVRQWAQNNPVTFLEMAADPENEQELIDFGILPGVKSSQISSPQLDGVTPAPDPAAAEPEVEVTPTEKQT